ncbi:MAG: hypothetical protein AAFS10_04775, partial [Myxococcota bacterium]
MSFMVTADDIDTWAGNAQDASILLPKLVQRLILATPVDIESIAFGSNVNTSGYDGVVHAGLYNALKPSERFVPSQGVSVWELSVGKEVVRKAQEDFDKRTKEPGEVDPSQTTYVAVTGRHWPKSPRDISKRREAWRHARRDKGPWHDVRVLDAEGLAAWLSLCPAVEIWFADLIGKRPPGVYGLERYAREWEENHFLQLGERRLHLPVTIWKGEGERNRVVRLIREWCLSSDVRPCYLDAPEPEDALLFAIAALISDDWPGREEALARTVVVPGAAEWRALLDRSPAAGLILLPTFHVRGVAGVDRPGERRAHIMIPHPPSIERPRYHIGVTPLHPAMLHRAIVEHTGVAPHE